MTMDIDKAFGFKMLEPPARCCCNCVFCHKNYRSDDTSCFLKYSIIDICNIDSCFSFNSIERTDVYVCDMFCSKSVYDMFAKIKTADEYTVFEAAGAFADCDTHPLVMQMFKNGFFTKNDATDKQVSYAKKIAKHADNLGYFKDNDFYGCPPLMITDLDENPYSIRFKMSSDKMALRHYIGLHDAWFKANVIKERKRIDRWWSYAGMFNDNSPVTNKKIEEYLNQLNEKYSDVSILSDFTYALAP